MGNTALLVLEREITEYQVDIENLKIKIADCVIKVHSTSPQEVTVIFDNLHKMAKLIEEVRPQEIMLCELFKTQSKIEDILEEEELRKTKA